MNLPPTSLCTDDIRELCSSSLIWDAHAGIFPAPDADLQGVTSWRDHLVDYVSINIGFDLLDWETSLRTLLSYRRKIGLMSDSVQIIRSVGDILKARAEGKLAVSFDIEGVNALNGDVTMVSVYYDLGVRQMLLAYNLNNLGGGGCHDIDNGLSAFGRQVIAEMNRVGMIVDASHVGLRTSLEMMEHSESPVVFSHSNPTVLCKHQRNITDEQIRACASQGGVVGINGMGIFLGDNITTDNVYADHACYVAELVGPEHVAIGLDWKPPMKSAPDLGSILRSRPDYWPVGQRYDTAGIKIVSPAQIPSICTILASRGWTRYDLEGLLGRNFFSLAQRIWKG